MARKKTTKKAEKPQVKPVTLETPKLATVLEFTGKPNSIVEVLVEVEGKRKLIDMPGEYKDFQVGQIIEIK